MVLLIIDPHVNEGIRDDVMTVPIVFKRIINNASVLIKGLFFRVMKTIYMKQLRYSWSKIKSVNCDNCMINTTI